MNESEPIEQEDLNRLKRLSNSIESLRPFEEEYIVALIETGLARVKEYSERFITLSRIVTERVSQHQAQLRSVEDLETRVRQNENERVETQAKLKKAIEAPDVDTIALLNARIPAYELARDSLENKLEGARQQLEKRWQSVEGARSPIEDLRLVLDRDSSQVEHVVRELTFRESENADPKIRETRERIAKLLDARYEPPSLPQPEASKVIHLTRRADELAFQVTRTSESYRKDD